MNANKARQTAMVANLKAKLPDVVRLVEEASKRGEFSCVVSRERVGPQEVKLITGAGYRVEQESEMFDEEVGEGVKGDFVISWS